MSLEAKNLTCAVRCAADGYPTSEMSQQEVLARLRGPSGSVVNLTVVDRLDEAGGATQAPMQRSLALERRPIPQPPLKQVTIRTSRSSMDCLYCIRTMDVNLVLRTLSSNSSRKPGPG